MTALGHERRSPQLSCNVRSPADSRHGGGSFIVRLRAETDIVRYVPILAYPRGPHRMTAAPIRHIEAPAISQRSGRTLSTAQSQKSDATM